MQAIVYPLDYDQVLIKMENWRCYGWNKEDLLDFSVYGV